MDDAKCELVRDWLATADRDLTAARRLASGNDPLWDMAVYHCQQAGEKAVKGWLVFQDRRFKKTHDVVDLVKTAETCDDRFSAWHDAAKLLTPYAQAFRYPAEAPDPDEETYASAEEAAAGIFAFVCSLLPKEACPELRKSCADRGTESELQTIYVHLIDDGVAVWRPVFAERVGESAFRITSQEYDHSIERWEFGPGETVYCEPTQLSEGVCLVAKRLA